MNRVVPIFYVLGAGAIALFVGRGSLESSMYLFQERAGDTVVLAVAGWLMATLSPIALSVCVWLAPRPLKARWLPHLLFIPMAIAIAILGVKLFFYGAKASGDNMPEVTALVLAAVFLLLTLLVHTAALIVEGYRNVTLRAHGS